MEQVTANYNCSQPSLYEALFLLAENARNNQAKLNSYKNKYTDQFLDDFVELVEEAKALKNEQQRAAEHESLRIDLVALFKTCHRKFQMAKGYIEEAFEESKWVLNLTQAGWNYYDSTNWSDCSEMNNMLVSYITANKTKLETDGFMGTTFLAEATAASQAFSEGLSAFLLAQEHAHAGTQAKLIKSNEAYAAGIAICKDGTIVAHNEENPAMADLFSFEALLGLVRKDTASSLVVELTNAETEMPLAGAVISITGSNKTGTTNSDGRAEINQLPAEMIHGTITADGFPEQPFTATLTGVTTRIKLSLTPLFTGEMKVGSEGSSQPAMKMEN